MLKIGVNFFNLRQFYLINFLLKWFYEKKTAKKSSQIYPSRKSSDSSGDFKFGRAGKTNSKTL